MKKVLLILSGVVLVASSCLKDKPNTDFSSITPIAELTTASTSGTPQAPVSGLAFWTGAAIAMNDTMTVPITVTFTANIASDYPLNVATPFTLAVDTPLVSSFNSSGTSPNTFGVLPSSDYNFAVTTGTVPAGQRLDTFTVVVNPVPVPDSVYLMLPISITNAGSVEISGNLSTIYFNVYKVHVTP